VSLFAHNRLSAIEAVVIEGQRSVKEWINQPTYPAIALFLGKPYQIDTQRNNEDYLRSPIH
jgi:hypothetical protein